FARLLLQLGNEIDTAVGWRIAAIEETVNKYALNFVVLGHAQQCEQMPDMRMYAAIAYQADEVKLPLPAALHRLEQQRLLKERACLDCRVNASDVHMNNSSGADIQVAHL